MLKYMTPHWSLQNGDGLLFLLKEFVNYFLTTL